MVDAEKRLSQILTEIGNLAPVILNERQQRLISGSIAKGYGYGGDKIVSDVHGKVILPSLGKDFFTSVGINYTPENGQRIL